MNLTKAKTRKGILTWLAKVNPAFAGGYFTKTIYNNARIVAVHVRKDNGQVVSWEYDDGKIIPLYSLTALAA